MRDGSLPRGSQAQEQSRSREEQFRLQQELMDANEKMQDIINAIPGGVAYCLYREGRLNLIFFSDGVPALTGYSGEEFKALVGDNMMDLIYEPDRERVRGAFEAAWKSGGVLDVSYRMRHKDGDLVWIHLNGRHTGPSSDATRFYAVFTGISKETRLFQSVANESEGGIYVIDKESYELLYISESRELFAHGRNCLGQKCYAALHGKSEPCAFCTLKSHPPDGQEHEMVAEGSDRVYSTRFRETNWGGIPAYIKYVRDITEMVKTRQDKERLEQYFHTVIKNLSGGVAVVSMEPDGCMRPEFLSAGFAELTGMTLDEAWALYRADAAAGVHPDERERIRQEVEEHLSAGENSWEVVYRLARGKTGYIWVKAGFSRIRDEGGESRVFIYYQDITHEREEQERSRRQYDAIIFQHYHRRGPDTLVVGHCNVTQDRILEVMDETDSNLLQTFSDNRERFFTGLSGLVVEQSDREKFLKAFLRAPALEAFSRGESEQRLTCFVQFPRESRGRYVEFKMDLVDTPDSGDITGILTLTDVTRQTLTRRVMHQLSVIGYDFVVGLNLLDDHFTVLSCDENAHILPPHEGCHSEWTAMVGQTKVVPRDREQYQENLNPRRMLERLNSEGPYTFSFSMTDENGEIRTKNMLVSAADLRLGCVCLARTDITESVREQQGLLNMIAYTFELAAFLRIGEDRMTMYTRKTVLENLPPYIIEGYDAASGRFADQYGTEEDQNMVREQFRTETMIRRLTERPEGYDFVLSYRQGDDRRYKQINVLWGDVNHKTICLVRADVTDMLAVERRTKRELEHALALAEEANQAKSDFLSSMSHDIRTPMNAIMGMTALAVAHLDDRNRVEDCLRKISISSSHLLSLVNDILDMSKIERSKITLNRNKLRLKTLMEQVYAIMEPQAKTSGVTFDMQEKDVVHSCFYGDSLRINQILINLLSNAVKFTPQGGRVLFLAEELPPRRAQFVRYRFTVRDTGIGMSEEFLSVLFSPFTRGRAAARIEGTGLGLSITKGLVDLMGGVITVESRVEAGSTFRVELEFETAGQDEAGGPDGAQAHPASDTAARALLAGRRVLVAEDNAINAEILCGLLELYGVKTVVKTNGAQALQAFRDASPEEYDAILMDIQMPEMNGYEATRAIRELPRPDAASIPIVAMTANAFAEDVQASLEAGMNAHVSKPIDVERLVDTLCRVLARDGGRR